MLATVDETTYDPGEDAMGSGHPVAWSHAYDGGRAWYTAVATPRSRTRSRFLLAHLLSGILWAAGPAPAQAAEPDPARIVSLTAMLRRDRLVVATRHPACPSCYEVLDHDADLRAVAAPQRANAPEPNARVRASVPGSITNVPDPDSCSQSDGFGAAKSATIRLSVVQPSPKEKRPVGRDPVLRTSPSLVTKRARPPDDFRTAVQPGPAPGREVEQQPAPVGRERRRLRVEPGRERGECPAGAVRGERENAARG